MTQEHPITPPPELVQQWWDGTYGALYEFEAVATQAARWGADQELEACCEWLKGTAHIGIDFELLHARRSEPLSLKERGLKALLECYRYIPDDLYGEIAEAIESLPD